MGRADKLAARMCEGNSTQMDGVGMVYLLTDDVDLREASILRA